MVVRIKSEVPYNYQHGTQTITLKEVEDFLGSDLVGLSPPRKRQPDGCLFCFYQVLRALSGKQTTADLLGDRVNPLAGRIE